MRSRIGLVALAGLLAACGDKPEPRIVLKPVPVATPVGCVVDRPEPPVSLAARFTDEAWAILAPGAKARAVEGQAGERLNYEDRMTAATSGCKDAPVAR